MSDFIGKWPLGYKEAGGNEDGLLGMEWYTTVEEHAAGRSFAIAATRVYVKWVKNTGATPITPGHFVQVDVSEDMIFAVEAVAAPGAQSPGVCDPTLTAPVAPGEKFLIVIEGATDVTVAAPVAKGAVVGVGAAGAAGGATPPYAIMAEAALAPGEKRRAIINCRGFWQV